MKTTLKFYTIMALSACLFAGCSKDDDNPNVPESVYDVYVAGYEDNGSETVATLWKNGTAQELINESVYAMTHSVYVSGNDVYVAGFESDGFSDVAKLWKNGIAEDLGDGTNSAVALSVYVIGDDVFVSGYVKNSSDQNVATLWKNGEAEDLFNDGGGHSVFVTQATE